MALQRIPRLPAIYAFFRRLELDASLEANEFTDQLCSLIKSPTALTWTGKLGPLYRSSLESRSELPVGKVAKLRKLSELSQFRMHLAELIREATHLQSPLYVGKADDLHGRISTHLGPSSDLAMRLSDNGIEIDACVLGYMVTANSVGLTPGLDLTLIEDVVSRLCRPGFVGRIG